MRPLLHVVSGAFSRSDPWTAPDDVCVATFSHSSTGEAPRLATELRAWRDETSLLLLFSAVDEPRCVATLYGRDEPLWKEDAVEAFLAPGAATHYFEFEASPAGTLFDATVHSPDGVRATMTVDTGWDCPGLNVFTRRTSLEGERWLWEALLQIPFAPLAGRAPRAGERWLGNFYRIDRSPEGNEFSAWSPTGATPPDFHIPAAFGEIVFTDEHVNAVCRR